MTDTQMDIAEKKRLRKKTMFSLLLGAGAGAGGAMGVLWLADSGALGELDASREVACRPQSAYFASSASWAQTRSAPPASTRV